MPRVLSINLSKFLSVSKGLWCPLFSVINFFLRRQAEKMNCNVQFIKYAVLPSDPPPPLPLLPHRPPLHTWHCFVIRSVFLSSACLYFMLVLYFCLSVCLLPDCGIIDFSCFGLSFCLLRVFLYVLWLSLLGSYFCLLSHVLLICLTVFCSFAWLFSARSPDCFLLVCLTVFCSFAWQFFSARLPNFFLLVCLTVYCSFA